MRNFYQCKFWGKLSPFYLTYKRKKNILPV